MLGDRLMPAELCLKLTALEKFHALGYHRYADAETVLFCRRRHWNAVVFVMDMQWES